MPANSSTDQLERRLFDEMLDQPAGPPRDAWLANACQGDESLRQRLLALLRVQEGQTEFLPEFNRAVESAAAGQPGEHIGHYKLLQQIGEGGFGTVWLAEQMEPVSRRVALKIIKLGMDTREVIARFEAERQALAMMDHANIAKVFDAGATETGRPFFVMELVKGVPITQYCDERELGMRERLALFGDVCSAINHAHQKGIIHRDIKPSNVMVSLQADKPVVKVIDFGIAKATQGKLTDRTLFTRFEQFIGTPAYMSPEQASLSTVDIDTRSDIYSLGVLLYELLTGKPPFDAKTLASAGYEEMRRIIREVEPPKPSSRLSTVAGGDRTTLAKARHVDPAKLHRLVEPDLDWIVMKAIEKDRTRRYETANGLALDIQRFLADEPVSATPPSAGYRFRKFARKNRTAIGVTTAIVALLVTGIVVSTLLAIRATDAESLAAKRLDRVELEKQRAVQERKVSQSILRFLQEKLLLMASPTAQADAFMLAGMPSSGVKPNPTILELLDRAALEATDERLEVNFPNEPILQAEILETVGLSYQGIGRYHEAVPFLKRGLARKRQFLGSEAPHTLKSMNLLAAGLVEDGRQDEAIPLLEECIGLCRAKSLDTHRAALAYATNTLALALQKAGKVDRALELFEQLLQAGISEVAARPADEVILLSNMALACREAGKKQPALDYTVKALDRARAVLGDEHPLTIHIMGNASLNYLDMEMLEAGLSLAEEALRLASLKFGPDHPVTSLYKSNLAVLLAESGRSEDAMAAAREALDQCQAQLGPDHPQTFAAMHNVGGALLESGRVDDAIAWLEDTCQKARAALGRDDPVTLKVMNLLSPAYQAAGKLEEKVPHLIETLELHKGRFGTGHPDTLMALSNLIIGCSSVGDLERALTYVREFEKQGLEHSTPMQSMVAGAKASAALKLLDGKQWSEAEELLRECLKVREEIEPEKWTTASTKSMLGAALAGQKLAAEAEPLLVAGGREMLERKASIPVQGRQRLTQALNRLVSFYESAGRPEEAARWKMELDANSSSGTGAGENRSGDSLQKTPAAAGVLVSPASAWKWLHPVDGSDPEQASPGFHRRFFLPDMHDSAWKSGRDSDDPDGGFGYGLSFTGVSIGRPENMDHRRTAYFRHAFKTDKAHQHLELRLRFDDGIIVYLDGKEILRENMPAGPDAWKMPSKSAVAPGEERILRSFKVPGPLPAGDHILALSVHNSAQPSSDLRLGGVTLVEVAAEDSPTKDEEKKSP
jgi:serine/threonine protein kinase/tetratricopeptide (TPR) repeat protein